MKYLSILSLALMGCDARSAASSAPLVVFAASSVRELIDELADAWTKRTGREVRVQYEASSVLARQIQEGARADLFISASPAWLGQVNARSRFDWLSNRLVCVVRKDAGEVDLRSVGRWALANEEVPVGAYAKAALAYLGITPVRVIYGANVRDVLGKISHGGATAGVVYATDAALDPEVRVAYVFPEESHPRIVYGVGVLTEAGEDFARVLCEPASIERACQRGFLR